MRIALLTNKGEFVYECEIPCFMVPPDSITWGSRIFIRNENVMFKNAVDALGKTVGYVEGFHYTLPDTRTT